MTSPAGWVEPGQRPEFDEYTLVLEGWLRVEGEAGVLEVRAGQAVHAAAGGRVPAAASRAWPRSPAGPRSRGAAAPRTRVPVASPPSAGCFEVSVDTPR